MGDVRLNTPRVRVVRDGVDDIELQTTNADLVLWDRTRLRHKWPQVSDAPFLWLTFIAWAAARRTGAITPDHRYEAWEVEVLEVETLTDDEGEDEGGRPTDPAHDLD
jgi:hypothetical protein